MAMGKWHKLTNEEVLKQLDTDASGLANTSIPALQQKHGLNHIEAVKPKSKWAIFASQFRDVMILILVVAAVISFSVGERIDAYVILAIIFGNALIGFYQENNAEESVRMLQKMTAQHAMVLRDGKPSKIETQELVPGDVILLEAGDIVPADARLLEVSSLRTEEAALTGESHSVEKNIAPLEEENLLPGDQYNMVFKSTIISNGSAKAVVTSTGMNTEIGKIAGLLEVENQKTPLQKRLAVFSKQLAVIVILICLAVFGFGLWRGEPPFIMFLTALSLAVAALPEALPAVITISLAQGAKRMVRQKALVRVLPAVETLGSVTYICSDKTGTLTQNVMTVEKVKTAEGKEDLLYATMVLTNEVRFSDDGVLGDSTETALVNYALEQGLSRAEMEKGLPLVEKLPFDSVRMRMSTLHQYKNQWVLLAKGAPVKIAEALVAGEDQKKEEWLDINREWAAEGLRVLFFAYKIFDEKPSEITEDLERDMDFLGISAMIDPPREEVIEAIQECKTAGIKSVMITGDQPLTAYAIAERLQLIDEAAKGTMTGAELEKLSEEEYRKTIQEISVYARVSPAQKMKIVKTLQDNGQYVAMTGDGVNDAPSLKQADIGVAMGITGTDVSKEAADLILLDDNFATIVKAVKEGRRIYENIKKFILYILSCNIAEILTIVFAPVFGLAIPLLPIHILWINLVTDGLPGIALASEPAEEGVMQRPPRSPNENLFAGGLISKILGAGIIMAVAAIVIQSWATNQGYEVEAQQTMVFTTLCFVQLGNALSVRFSFHSIVNRRLFTNWKLWGAIALTVALQLMLVYIPGLHVIFSTTALDGQAMSMIGLAVVCSVIGVELVKFSYNNLAVKRKGKS
jgi:Ca2+-transporting ATPase